MTTTTADALRAWAKGIYPSEAGVELLRETGAWSGGERRLVRIAASLLGGPAVDLSEDVPGLDRQAAALVLAAIAHANGSHEHSEFQFNEDGTPRGFSRVPTLYPWPETR